jgi:uncharacterized protein YggU (UPF0235/DUF167 family)
MLVKVKVLSQSSRRGIIKKPDNSFEVRVKEKPIGGRANKAVLELLADYFQWFDMLTIDPELVEWVKFLLKR